VLLAGFDDDAVVPVNTTGISGPVLDDAVDLDRRKMVENAFTKTL